MAETFNPFLNESNNENTNPFNDEEDEQKEEFFHQNGTSEPPQEIKVAKYPIELWMIFLTGAVRISSKSRPVQNQLFLIATNGPPRGQKASSYTSLEEQQVTTIMRSVSVDEDQFDFTTPATSEDQDLLVRVERPEKHVEGYVSYLVVTKTTRVEFQLGEYQVRRRYQDFLWLRQRITETHPNHIIPPLPEKFTFSQNIKDKFDVDFLKTRQKALHKFIQRVVNHPLISYCEDLRTFLTAKAWEMTTARKKEPGVASRMTGNVKNTAAQFMMKHRSEEFSDILKYNLQFQLKVKSFQSIADTIANERFALMSDFQEYGSTFELWSNSETELANTLNAVSDGLEKNKLNVKSLVKAHGSRICEPLREYNLYCEAVKDAMKRRDQTQIEEELSNEELQKRKAEKEEVENKGETKTIQTLFGKDPEQVYQEKVEKLDQQITELLTETEVLSDKREKADHDFKSDIERWEKNKKEDLKALLLEIAERHIKYYEANTAAWQEAYETISNPRKTNSASIE